MVGELIGLFQILGREQHRGAVADQLSDEVPDVVAGPGIESGCRFVEEQDLWSAHEARTQIESTTHAA